MPITRLRFKTWLTCALLLSCWATCIHQAEAAVATAKVTVRVVPASALHISQRFDFSIPADKENQLQQTENQLDQNQVTISSLSNKSAVIVKVDDNQHNTYDLSISSRSTLTGSSSSDTMTINNMEVNRYTSNTNDNNQHRLLIDGELSMPDSDNTGHYTGTTEITINYN